MGLLDTLREAGGFARAAIQPAAAVRSGYLQGEQVKSERERADAIRNAQLQRQSYLDELKATLDASTIDRNTAQADRARRAPVTTSHRQPRNFSVDGKAVAGAYDPATGKYYDSQGKEVSGSVTRYAPPRAPRVEGLV